ncbi:MAG: lipoprotein insertase outer membrane protein LolB [Gammaproteobacteria bacterium]
MKLIRACCLVLLLTGCAAVPVTETARSGRTYSPAHAAVENWSFNGRVSLQRGEEGWHAGLTWQEHSGAYRLKVIAPLGQEAFQLTGGTAAGVVLQTAAGQRYMAPDADRLLAETTGWDLPVSGLRYWVRGMPAPNTDSTITTDGQARLVRLSQSGWDINYIKYQLVDGDYWPAKLHLSAADVKVRLIIDQWQLKSADPGP